MIVHVILVAHPCDIRTVGIEIQMYPLHVFYETFEALKEFELTRICYVCIGFTSAAFQFGPSVAKLLAGAIDDDGMHVNRRSWAASLISSRN